MSDTQTAEAIKAMRDELAELRQIVKAIHPDWLERLKQPEKPIPAYAHDPIDLDADDEKDGR